MKHDNPVCPVCNERCVITSSNRYMTQYQCKGIGHMHKVYKKWEPEKKPHGDVAARREPFPFRELRRDPFAFRDLAMTIGR